MKRIITFFLCAITLFPCIAFTIAAAGYENIATSDVLTDLKGMTFSGEPFEESTFPVNKEADYIQILSFLEVNYDYSGDQSGYGIYIYVYNPSLKKILNSSKNKIQIAAAASRDETGIFRKYELDEISRTSDSRFIKYKISDLKPGTSPSFLYNLLDPMERIYNISGIELLVDGSYNATDFEISAMYVYTGFMQGYGRDKKAASTLKCETDSLLTVKLDLQSTVFRTETSSLGLGHQNEVMSVYFSFPGELFKQFDFLYSIQGEYSEYKIESIVTTSLDAYNQWSGSVGGRFYGINGEPVPESDKYFFMSTASNQTMIGTSPVLYRFDHSIGFNVRNGMVDISDNLRYFDYVIPRVPYFYFRTELVEDGKYDVSPQQVIDKVNQEGLYYMEDGVTEEGHKQGLQSYDVVFDELYSFSSYKSNHEWWDWLLSGENPFGWQEVPRDDYKNVKPIELVEDYMLRSDDETVSKNLLVHIEDMEDFRDYYNDETALGNVVHLFRFSVNDFYKEALNAYDSSGNILAVESYYGRQTYIDDFDILSLTFKDKKGGLVKISVSADPRDMAGGLNQDPKYDGDWVIELITVILGLVLILFAVWIVYKVGMPIAEYVDRSSSRRSGKKRKHKRK